MFCFAIEIKRMNRLIAPPGSDVSGGILSSDSSVAQGSP